MSFNVTHENKNLTKISYFTVHQDSHCTENQGKYHKICSIHDVDALPYSKFSASLQTYVS